MATKTQTKPNLDPPTVQIPLHLIDGPKNPDRASPETSKIKELADSIQCAGQLQDIALMKDGDRYEIIFGHRRFLALKSLNRTHIKAKVYSPTDNRLILVRWHENRGRENLTPVETALSLHRLMTELKLSMTRLATVTGMSQPAISQHLAILKYPHELRQALNQGYISFSAARELFRIKTPRLLLHYLNQTINNGASLSVLKSWVDACVLDEQQTDSTNDDNYEPPPSGFSEPPMAKCYMCDQHSTYDRMINLWSHRDCIQAAINAIMQLHPPQKDG